MGLFFWGIIATELWVRTDHDFQKTSTHATQLGEDNEKLKSHLYAKETLIQEKEALIQQKEILIQKKKILIERLIQKYQLTHRELSSLSVQYENLQKDYSALQTKYEEIRNIKALPLLKPEFKQMNWEKKGEVVETNPVYGFVLVNMGKESGVMEGQPLLISRNGIFLNGILTVDRVYNSLSACSGSFGTSSEAPHPGDAVFIGQSADIVKSPSS